MRKAEQGTIRGDFSALFTKSCAGSDSAESAELEYLFN